MDDEAGRCDGGSEGSGAAVRIVISRVRLQDLWEAVVLLRDEAGPTATAHDADLSLLQGMLDDAVEDSTGHDDIVIESRNAQDFP